MKHKLLKVTLHPNEVVSRSDGEIHFIGGAQLCSLYKVLPTDDVVTFDRRNPTHTKEWERDHGISRIHLYPRYEGDYYDIHEYDDIEPIKNKKYVKT